MKRELYSLVDEEFAFFVDKLGEELKRRQIPHLFVGGTAVQAHILDRLIEKYELDLTTLSLGGEARLQDYVRSTDDIDIALKFPDEGADEREVARAINDFCESVRGEYISKTENHIFEYGLDRKGIKRPIFSVSVDGEGKDGIVLNISRKPVDLRNLESRFYGEFIEAGQDLVIPYSAGANISIRVPKPEHILSTKISHFRAKDTMDMYNLVSLMRAAGEEIDMGEIERILLPEYTKKFEKFLSLIEAQ